MQKDNLGAVQTDPWRVQVLKIDPDQARLRLPKPVWNAVSWLTSADRDIACLATVGARGGIMVSPRSMLSTRSRVSKEVSIKQLPRGAVGSEMLDYIRYSAASWPHTISVESSRYTLHMPEEARKLALVPGLGELAVVFAVGEILEVWTPSDFLTYLRGIGGNIRRLEQAILHELDADLSED